MLALLLTALALPVPSPPPALAAPADSLEEFLRKARAKKEVRLTALRGPVADMVARLEERGRAGPRRELDRIRKELDSLGIEAALLLLPHLDPGTPATTASKFRASEIAEALIRMRTASITEPLIQMAGDSAARARVHAIRLLGHAPDRARASRFLAKLFRGSTGTIRQECVISLARQGGPDNTAVLREALGDENAMVVGAVLEALATAHAVEAAEGVRGLVRDGGRATKVVTQILGYFTACPEVAKQEAMVELLQFAASESGLDRTQRLEILDAIPPFDPNLDGKIRNALAPLLAQADIELQEAGQICLALLGDRGARRDLKRKYDDWIREQQGYSTAIEKRGVLLLKLQEYPDAAKDFKRAIETREARGQSVPRDLHIDLARAHVLGGKLRQGRDALKSAYLSRGQLRQVAEDPDFKELVEHSRYGEIFD